MLVHSLCVFCGSHEGYNPVCRETAIQLGSEIARRNIRLVYGAGDRGLMGIVAKAVKEHDGVVIGVTPQRFSHSNVDAFPIDEYIEVDSMATRKKIMAEKADAFVAMPGGIGTLEEISETFSQRQLGYHGKPVVLLNIGHFWDPFLLLMKRMLEDGFLSEKHYMELKVCFSVAELFAYLDAFVRVKGLWEP